MLKIPKINNFLKKATVVGGLILGTLPIFSQKHNLDFKVRELTNGQGANIENVKVDLNNGEYIGFTNSQGELILQDVQQGTYTVTISKPGFIKFVQSNYTLDSDKTFNACIPSKTRIGPWGTDNFNVDWYKKTFQSVGMAGENKDPPQWKQIAPINNRLAPGVYSQADSLLVVSSINMLENGTGYNLITLVPSTASKDTTYTIELNSYTNFSQIGGNNGMIVAGKSQITKTGFAKRIIHEITQQFDMWPYFEPIPCPASVMDPAVQTMTNPQVWDLDNIAITMDQHYAKARGEQNLFLGNMQEYTAPIVPTKTTNTKPTNGSIDLNKIVNIAWNKIAGSDRYHVDIATDNTFNNIVKDLMINRIDTLITLEDGKTYFMRVSPENNAGNAPWSNTTTFSTKSLIVMPGATSITSPTNNATEVPMPVSITCSTATNALQYEFVGKDLQGNTVLDTVVNNTQIESDRFKGNRTYSLTVKAKNTNGYGPTSASKKFTTYDTEPSTFEISLENNATITYVNGKLAIPSTTATDIDNDNLSKNYHITGPSLDTIIHSSNIETIYLDSTRLQLDSQYNIEAEVTDGTKTTQANPVNIKTPKANGIKDIIIENTKIYPNPTSNYLNIDLESKKSTTIDIEIYDITGKLIDNIHENISGTYKEQIDMTKYKTGTYIMQIHSDNELIKTAKIIKE